MKTNALIDFIQDKVRLDAELIETIHSVCHIDSWKKGKLLIRSGKRARHVYLIQKGSARTFYYHDGKEVTSWIYSEGQLVTAWSSFYTGMISSENTELTEDSTVVSISFEQLQLLYKNYPKMQEFGRLMVEEQLVFIDYFYKGFMFMTAKEKYELLLSYFPEVTLRVNLGHIASFLGISQETLSRIRKMPARK